METNNDLLLAIGRIFRCSMSNVDAHLSLDLVMQVSPLIFLYDPALELTINLAKAGVKVKPRWIVFLQVRKEH